MNSMHFANLTIAMTIFLISFIIITIFASALLLPFFDLIGLICLFVLIFGERATKSIFVN